MLERGHIDIIFFNAVPQTSFFDPEYVGCFFLYTGRLFQGIDDDAFFKLVQPMVEVDLT